MAKPGATPSRPSRLGAIIAQRCPVCLTGPMFAGLFRMWEVCPTCGHRFMREPGFFQGAMYVSYSMGLVTFLLLLLFCQYRLAPRIGLTAAYLLAFALQLCLVPILWRYSRVIWAHLNIGTRQR